MRIHWRRVLPCLIFIILLTTGSTTAVADDSAAPPVAGEAVERTAAGAEAPLGLDDALRSELRARSAQYDGDYAGTGDRTSTIRIHWPTVILIAAIIIIL